MKKINDNDNNNHFPLLWRRLGKGVLFMFLFLSLPFGKGWGGDLSAQQMPFSSQYYSNPFVINPAYAGVNENINVFLTHRSQWTGLAGSPKTSYFTIDGPIRAKNSSLGLKLYSDVTDIISRVGAFANYSYKFKISDSTNLYFGVACGVFDNKIDFSKAHIKDTDDPFLSQQAQNKTVVSADFGVVYVRKKLTVGFAVPQAFGNRLKYPIVNGTDGFYSLSRHYQGTVKYVFDLSKEKEITAYPLIMIRTVKGAPFQYDINGVIDWRKIGWIGATYHSNYAMAISAGVRYRSFSVGYAFDIRIGKISSYTGSTSEFLLGYVFQNKKDEERFVKTEDPRINIADLSGDGGRTLDSIQFANSQLKLNYDSNLEENNKLKIELEKEKALASAEAKTETNKTKGAGKDYSGKFVGDDNTPLANSKVNLVNEQGEIVQTSTTDGMGAFQFNYLSPDQNVLFELDVNDPQLKKFKKVYLADNNGNKVREVYPDKAVFNKLKIELEKEKALASAEAKTETNKTKGAGKDYSGKFVGDDNTPLANSKVNLVNEQGEIVQTSTTDGMGAFQFNYLSPDQNVLFELDVNDPQLKKFKKVYLADNNGNKVREVYPDKAVFGSGDLNNTIAGKNNSKTVAAINNTARTIPTDKENDDLIQALAAKIKAMNKANEAKIDSLKAELVKQKSTEVVNEPASATASITIRLVDEKGNIISDAVIKAMDVATQKVISTPKIDSDGYARMSVPSGKMVDILITKTGFLYKSFNVTPTAGSETPLEDVKLEKVAVGKKLVMNNIRFELNEAKLDERSFSELDNTLKLLKDIPSLVVEIAGHTDNRGAAALNETLSMLRAKAAHDYLIRNGGDKNRITYKGYGSSQPIASNDTKEGRKLNRRIEFQVLKVAPEYAITSGNAKQTLTKILETPRERSTDKASQELAVGKKIVAENISFDVNETSLKPESSALLDVFVKLMKDIPSLEIEIAGHTDNIGSSKANQELSVQRARSVFDYIVNKGVDQNRITFKGYGSSDPIESNNSLEGRKKNRRIEFEIVKVAPGQSLGSIENSPNGADLKVKPKKKNKKYRVKGNFEKNRINIGGKK